jgi:hypothetical protein
MSVPDVPSIFRASVPPEQPWWWEMLSASGEAVEVSAEFADQRFVNQGDAESWVGEIWQDLADQGVAGVTLHEHERVVYGPMSLSV